MKGPQGIAIDATGNLHVASNSGNAVKMYSQGGEYISEYGSNKVAGACGICIDAEGYSFVGTYTNPGRVEVFDLEHKHIKTITGLCFTCHLTLDNDGFLYAGDHNNRRVLKY